MKRNQMKKTVYLFWAATTVVMASCATKPNTVRYTIASQKGDCVGVAPQKCLLVKKGNATEWEFFYSPIEGFNYEDGYEYVLEVKEEKRKHVPADASSVKYTLVKEIAKTANTSRPLPVLQKQYTLQWTGKVLEVEKNKTGQEGTPPGKFLGTIVKAKVTSTVSDLFKAGDTIHCELIASPSVMPEIGREYVFKAKGIRPASANGVYTLETNVQDLV